MRGAKYDRELCGGGGIKWKVEKKGGVILVGGKNKRGTRGVCRERDHCQ